MIACDRTALALLAAFFAALLAPQAALGQSPVDSQKCAELKALMDDAARRSKADPEETYIKAVHQVYRSAYQTKCKGGAAGTQAQPAPAVQPAPSAQPAKPKPNTAKRSAALQLFREGRDLYRAGDFEGAVERFEDGFKLDDTIAAAHYWYAKTLTSWKDKYYENRGRAYAHYKRATELGPDTKAGVLAVVEVEKVDTKRKEAEAIRAVHAALIKQMGPLETRLENGKWIWERWVGKKDYCTRLFHELYLSANEYQNRIEFVIKTTYSFGLTCEMLGNTGSSCSGKGSIEEKRYSRFKRVKIADRLVLYKGFKILEMIGPGEVLFTFRDDWDPILGVGPDSLGIVFHDRHWKYLQKKGYLRRSDTLPKRGETRTWRFLRCTPELMKKRKARASSSETTSEPNEKQHR